MENSAQENFTDDEGEQDTQTEVPEPDAKRPRQQGPAPPQPEPEAPNTTTPEAPNTKFPDELWALITNDVKLREKDEVIHEMRTRPQEKGICYPEMLEQAPQSLIASIFPLETHARHHVGILHVQAMLRRRSEAMYTVAAQAIDRLANEQAKARKAKKGKGLTDSEGEDEMTRKPFNATGKCTKRIPFRVSTCPTSTRRTLTRRGLRWE